MQKFKENLIIVSTIVSMLLIQASYGMMEFSCTIDKDCAPYQDKQFKSICTNHICTCTDTLSNNATVCVPRQEVKSNYIGEKCPCGIPNARCNLTSTKCECQDDYVETPDKLRCIKVIVSLAQPCEMNEQCVRYDKNAVCHESSCRCLKNFAMHDNTCRAIVRVGEKCENNVQCSNTTTNVTCIEHECTCDKFFAASKDGKKCIPFSNYHENCTESIQCENGLGPGSLCDNGKCICDNNYTNITDGSKIICQRSVRYGDYCKEHSDCSHFLTESTMLCHQSNCVCRETYELYDSYSGKCVKIEATAGAADYSKMYGIFVVFGIAVVRALF